MSFIKLNLKLSRALKKCPEFHFSLYFVMLRTQFKTLTRPFIHMSVLWYKLQLCWGSGWTSTTVSSLLKQNEFYLSCIQLHMSSQPLCSVSLWGKYLQSIILTSPCFHRGVGGFTLNFAGEACKSLWHWFCAWIQTHSVPNFNILADVFDVPHEARDYFRKRATHTTLPPPYSQDEVQSWKLHHVLQM